MKEQHNIPRRLVLNPDEKGLQSGSQKTDQKKCFVPLEVLNTVKLQSDNLQLVTIIECVTAEGVALDPAFIFPGEGHFETWYDVPVLRNPNTCKSSFVISSTTLTNAR